MYQIELSNDVSSILQSLSETLPATNTKMYKDLKDKINIK